MFLSKKCPEVVKRKRKGQLKDRTPKIKKEKQEDTKNYNPKVINRSSNHDFGKVIYLVVLS